MAEEQLKDKEILITGGTSGLGLELVRLLLQSGYRVVSTGRQQVKLHGFEDRFTFYNVDFSDLGQVAAVTKNICINHSFSIVVYNAGILSPPEYTETADGLEYSFQVNFLAHLLINEYILRGLNADCGIRIASVTSPVYRLVTFYGNINSGSEDYRAMRAYSSSKLYLTMMAGLITSRHPELDLQFFSFDPGTFSSGIHRMQKPWFRVLYHLAAPFMRNPARVAEVLAELILKDKIVNGAVYDIFKRQRSLPEMDSSQKAAFMNACYSLIDPFLV